MSFFFYRFSLLLLAASAVWTLGSAAFSPQLLSDGYGLVGLVMTGMVAFKTAICLWNHAAPLNSDDPRQSLFVVWQYWLGRLGVQMRNKPGLQFSLVAASLFFAHIVPAGAYMVYCILQWGYCTTPDLLAMGWSLGLPAIYLYLEGAFGSRHTIPLQADWSR